MEIARFSDVAQDAVKTAGYVYVHDGEGDAARCVAAYKGTADLYKVSDTWYRFGERKAMTYKEFMARAYFALCFRPAMGAPAAWAVRPLKLYSTPVTARQPCPLT